MALGRQVPILEGQDADGEVTHRLVARERTSEGIPDRDPDMRVHITLSAGFSADNPNRIVVGQPVVIRTPVPFSKYSVLIFNAVTGFIGLGRVAGVEAGTYDQRHPGSGMYEERTPPTDTFSIVFSVAPADPVELVFYAGEPARAV